jgi:hypothetical protein
MRDIYLKRKDFELKFSPGRATDVMTPLLNPELFINGKMVAHTYPEGFQMMVPEKVSFECDLLLTNPTHDGIWLLENDETGTVSLPGGYIKEEDWIYASRNPYYVIYSAIIHSLINAHPVLSKNSECNPLTQISDSPTLAELFDILEYVLGQYSLETSKDSGSDLLYYQYRFMRNVIPNNTTIDDISFDAHPMRILIFKEVTNPDMDIPAFSNYEYNHMVWYSKREHRMNFRTSSDRWTLFQSRYQHDIRLDTNGIICLNSIFREENRFGKIDIY